MHIRDLIWDNLRMWPPEFGLGNQEVGEKGVLKNVMIRHDLKIKVIIVTATHLNNEGKGIIILEDPVLLEILYDKLKENIGKLLKDIGDMEINYARFILKNDLRQVSFQARAEAFMKISKIKGS